MGVTPVDELVASELDHYVAELFLDATKCERPGVEIGWEGDHLFRID